ncbi:hypothetical protein RB595_006412 [Gaeumannomyces hyphopodioides]
MRRLDCLPARIQRLVEISHGCHRVNGSLAERAGSAPSISHHSGRRIAPYIPSQDSRATETGLHSNIACNACLLQTPRWKTRNMEFPSVLEDQIPSFKTDVDVGADTLYGGSRTAENTVYAMWIGTNDLGGANAFLVDEHAPGATITNFTDCIWNVFDEIYSTGGRRFVLLNEAPLHLAPLYVPSAVGGIVNSTFWPTKTKYNETAYQQKILQYTTTVNTVFYYGVPFNLIVKRRWPGAKFSIFDVHSLMTDMSLNPTRYFDAPANSTGFYRHCDPKTGKCVDSIEPMSSFM